MTPASLPRLRRFRARPAAWLAALALLLQALLPHAGAGGGAAHRLLCGDAPPAVVDSLTTLLKQAAAVPDDAPAPGDRHTCALCVCLSGGPLAPGAAVAGLVPPTAASGAHRRGPNTSRRARPRRLRPPAQGPPARR